MARPLVVPPGIRPKEVIDVVHSRPRPSAGRAVTTMLAGTVACAPRATETPAVTPQAQSLTGQASTPVLLSCPAGQQPLMRQVVVNGAAVPQVECCHGSAVADGRAGDAAGRSGSDVRRSDPHPPPTLAPVPVAYQPVAPVAVAPRSVSRPRPGASPTTMTSSSTGDRRSRSWQKSAAIIGVGRRRGCWRRCRDGRQEGRADRCGDRRRRSDRLGPGHATPAAVAQACSVSWGVLRRGALFAFILQQFTARAQTPDSPIFLHRIDVFV